MRDVTRLSRLQGLGENLWSDGRGPMLVMVAVGWFVSLGVRMVYPAILPQLRSVFGFNLTTAGLLITSLWIAYALGQLPGGILDDRYGSSTLLVTSTIVSAGAIALVIAAGTVTLLFAGTVIFGFTTALYGVARFTLLGDQYPDHGGTAIGLVMAAGDLGNAILPPLAGVLAVTIAWEAGLGFAIPLFVVAAGGLYLTLPAITPGSGPSQPLRESLRAVGTAVNDRSVALVAVIQLIGYCVWQAFTAFYPTYLTEMKGLAPTTAAAVFGGLFGLGILVKPLTGAAYDAYGLERSLPVVMALITLTMVLLPFVRGLGMIVAITVLASSVLGYATLTLTYLTNSLAEEIRGTGLGVIRTGYMVVGAGSPTVVGVLADAGRFDEAFFLLGGLAFLGVICSVALARHL